jgi:FkbM family methyltransferase
MLRETRYPTYASATYNFGSGTRQFHFRQQSTDELVIKQVLTQQQYDLRRLRRFSELLRFVQQREALGRQPLIVDAGANIGASAIYFLGNLQNALVVAIEPDRDNFALLCKNVEGTKVKPIHAAISSSAGLAQVVDPGEGHWGYRTRPIVEDGAHTDTVNRVTITEIYAAHAVGFFPFIVKIDVEGAEQDVFSANTQWIDRTPLVIVELHDWLLPKAGTSRPFLQCISQLNRDFVSIGEDVYSIANDLDAL